jgi:hypothetical protein
VQAGRHDSEDATGHQWRRWAVSRANFRVLGLLGSYLPVDNIRELCGGGDRNLVAGGGTAVGASQHRI